MKGGGKGVGCVDWLKGCVVRWGARGLAAQTPPQSPRSPVGDHLFHVHVGLGAGAGCQTRKGNSPSRAPLATSSARGDDGLRFCSGASNPWLHHNSAQAALSWPNARTIARHPPGHSQRMDGALGPLRPSSGWRHPDRPEAVGFRSAARAGATHQPAGNHFAVEVR